MTAPLQLVAEEIWTVPPTLTLESRWRYAFGWRWAQGPTGLFIGINPSFGIAEKPDQTMMKWRGIAAHNGWGGYLAGNPFAMRATEPKKLTASVNLEAYAVGPGNQAALVSLIDRADVIVPCWGVVPRELWRIVSKLEIWLEGCGKPLKTLGRTKDGFPRHPLYLPYRTSLEAW